jgi:hypothetical protein
MGWFYSSIDYNICLTLKNKYIDFISLYFNIITFKWSLRILHKRGRRGRGPVQYHMGVLNVIEPIFFCYKTYILDALIVWFKKN